MAQALQKRLADLIAIRTPAILAETDDGAAVTLPTLTPAAVAAMIDHTLLKPEATKAQIEQLCREARDFGFASVCVNPTWVALCAKHLAQARAKVCTVIGFPLGAGLTTIKAQETEAVIRLGAQEVDMVINIGRLKDGAWAEVYGDIAAVVESAHTAARDADVLVKVIIETALLTPAEKVAASLLTLDAGADFVKTSTGFSSGGATVADVRLMRRTVGPRLGIKAAGGIRTGADAQQMIAAGATRLGASAGVSIVRSLQPAADATTGGSDKTEAARKGEGY
ncbi:MAG: deoxyribose-phosphate aldolase [Caldilineaceae bacterium]